MRKAFISIVVLLFFGNGMLLMAQVQRTVLLEVATSANCGPCSALNPLVYDVLTRNYGRMVSIWYHVWIPLPTDPMYLAGKQEIEERARHYYDIQAVPTYLLDGKETSAHGMEDSVNERLQVESPVELYVKARLVDDSLKTRIRLIVVSPFDQRELRLRAVITENMIEYPVPPGMNGEKEFPHVFRKFFGSPAGIAINDLIPGDTLDFFFAEKVDSLWNKDQLAVVAFLQSDVTREVIQAATDLTFHSLRAVESNHQILKQNHTGSWDYVIKNLGADSLFIRVQARNVEIVDTWEYAFVFNGKTGRSVIFPVAPADSVTFQLQIRTDSCPGYAKITIEAVNAGYHSHFTARSDFWGILPGGEVLLIETDNTKESNAIYVRAFEKHQVTYTVFPQDVVKQADLTPFRAIFWNMGWTSSPTLTNSDAHCLIRYLESGGNLFISGQDFGRDMFEGNQPDTGKILYTSYLDAQYVKDNANLSVIEGVSGNVISDGLLFELSSSYQQSPDVIASYSGKSVPILKYRMSGETAGLMYNAETYKAVYLAFGVEQIDGMEIQDLLLQRVLQWFGVITGVEEGTSVLSDSPLLQVYPNPFNAETNFCYTVPTELAGREITLFVYDSRGKEVWRYIQKVNRPGVYFTHFDAASLSSGIYFCRFLAGSVSISKKMILLK